MHPQRDLLLEGLVCRTARSGYLPKDLADIDAGWEFRRFLALAAAESGESDWSPRNAGLISQGRIDLMASGRSADQVLEGQWSISNRSRRLSWRRPAKPSLRRVAPAFYLGCGVAR
jgi:hypothetical protein